MDVLVNNAGSVSSMASSSLELLVETRYHRYFLGVSVLRRRPALRIRKSGQFRRCADVANLRAAAQASSRSASSCQRTATR